MAVALEMLPVHRVRTETPVLIDRRARMIVAPDGRRLRLLDRQRRLYDCLDALTRTVGVLVTREVMADALWPGEYRVEDDAEAMRKVVDRLRDALVSIGWTREVIDTVNGVGWRINVDEAERVRREARGE